MLASNWCRLDIVSVFREYLEHQFCDCQIEQGICNCVFVKQSHHLKNSALHL